MKVKEAPKKLYVDVSDNLSDSILYAFTEKNKDDDIEYIRKDAFVEETEEYIYKQLNEGHIECNDIETFIENFKAYTERK